MFWKKKNNRPKGNGNQDFEMDADPSGDVPDMEDDGPRMIDDWEESPEAFLDDEGQGLEAEIVAVIGVEDDPFEEEPPEDDEEAEEEEEASSADGAEDEVWVDSDEFMERLDAIEARMAGIEISLEKIAEMIYRIERRSAALDEAPVGLERIGVLLENIARRLAGLAAGAGTSPTRSAQRAKRPAARQKSMFDERAEGPPQEPEEDGED